MRFTVLKEKYVDHV